MIILYATERILRERMALRGDSPEAIEDRREQDELVFDDLWGLADHCIDATQPIDKQVYEVEEMIAKDEASTPTVRIWQINMDYDVRRVAYMDSKLLARTQGVKENPAINLSIYDEKWIGDPGISSLEELYQIFNRDDRPNRHGMHSLSVSDVVEIMHHPDPTLNGKWFCDSFGWRKIHEAAILS